MMPRASPCWCRSRRRFGTQNLRLSASPVLEIKSDNVRLSDMIRKPRHAGPVARVHWLDGPRNRDPGVGFSPFMSGPASRFIGGLQSPKPRKSTSRTPGNTGAKRSHSGDRPSQNDLVGAARVQRKGRLLRPGRQLCDAAPRQRIEAFENAFGKKTLQPWAEKPRVSRYVI